MVFTASQQGAQPVRISVKNKPASCLLCPWARHIMGCLRLCVANRWQGQAVYSSCWPSLTKDLQKEHELLRQWSANFFLPLPIADTVTNAFTPKLYKNLPMFIHLFLPYFWEWENVCSFTVIIFCYHYQKKVSLNKMKN